jgi:small subunit ribosomal protein S21
MKKYPTDTVIARPVQVEVRSGTREDFEYALRTFKSMVQKEKIISLYKEHQSYEKPSEKKRRKRREAAEKRYVMSVKQRQPPAGDDKRLQKKAQKAQERQ